MASRRSGLLLALLLLLQWTAAFGHCAALRLPALPLPAGICTAHDGPDAPAPDPAPPNAVAGLDCPACHLSPALDPVPPRVLPVRVT